MGYSQSEQQAASDLVTKLFPGVFGGEATSDAGAQYAARAAQIAEDINRGQDLGEIKRRGITAENVFNRPSSYEGQYQQVLLNPSFSPTSASEQALLNTLKKQVSGASAVRGLGTPASTALAQVIAPELVRQRQQRIDNLRQALALETAQKTQKAGTFQSLRGQDLQLRAQDTAAKAKAIDTMLNIASLAMPQIVAGSKSYQTGESKGGGIKA